MALKPTFDTTVYPPESSWGQRDGMWLDQNGKALTRDQWIERETNRRGRPPAIPPDRWDEAKELRLLYWGGVLGASDVAKCLGVSPATVYRFLDYEVLWWL